MQHWFLIWILQHRPALREEGEKSLLINIWLLMPPSHSLCTIRFQVFCSERIFRRILTCILVKQIHAQLQRVYNLLKRKGIRYEVYIQNPIWTRSDWFLNCKPFRAPVIARKLELSLVFMPYFDLNTHTHTHSLI